MIANLSDAMVVIREMEREIKDKDAMIASQNRKIEWLQDQVKEYESGMAQNNAVQHIARENEELRKKCRNLDEVLGSLDVRDPNACDALLNVQLQNQKFIHELKLENKALRDMYDGTQTVNTELRKKLDKARVAVIKASKMECGKYYTDCFNVKEKDLCGACEAVKILKEIE
jgi:regulator of replication initiation timing